LGLDFGLVDYLYMVVVALLVSAGTVGVPGTATITATAMFTAIGLPVEMIIVLTPISAIADMARTATNVTASGSTGLLVARFEKVLNLDQYYDNDGQEGKAYANS
ncbi:dicarboxylate/amino acid:cation symporter, partial [Streptococcus anginosus]